MWVEPFEYRVNSQRHKKKFPLFKTKFSNIPNFFPYIPCLPACTHKFARWKRFQRKLQKLTWINNRNIYDKKQTLATWRKYHYEKLFTHQIEQENLLVFFFLLEPDYKIIYIVKTISRSKKKPRTIPILISLHFFMPNNGFSAR